jgi:hypothetical protein
MLDLQARVIADKQVAQITADRKAISSISFKPLQRTSLMIRTCIYLCNDHLQRESHCLKRNDAAREMRDLFWLGQSISYRQIHMPSSFSGWNRRTGTSVSPDGPVIMRSRYAINTAAPLGVLLQNDAINFPVLRAV